MEKQMKAEREKRAMIAQSEGEKQARINVAEGEKQELIKKSEGEKQRKINEAEGKATEIREIAEATAKGITSIAQSINSENGIDAVNLRIAEQYLGEFGKMAKENNTMIIPSNMADISSIIATATSVIKKTDK
jgi:regulator of protease activity HflC (stomatin/prohibitin superfamily)